jgi:protein required for attachment to host cells
MNTWVLVADRARARLFSVTADGAALLEIADFVNPEGRALAHELESDRLPRTFESVGGARHAIEPHTTTKQKTADRFAHCLHEALERGRVERSYDQIVLVASPHFLGTLNAAIGKQVRRYVVTEVHKDLTTLTPAEIRQHLPKHLVT